MDLQHIGRDVQLSMAELRQSRKPFLRLGIRAAVLLGAFSAWPEVMSPTQTAKSWRASCSTSAPRLATLQNYMNTFTYILYYIIKSI